MWNDVTALRHAPESLGVAAELGCEVVLMHMQGEPRTMQEEPRYDDVVAEVAAFLRERVDACVGQGVSRDRLLVDPGIGFGKRIEHNLALLAALPERGELGLPVAVGVSRKAMLGQLSGRPVGDRLAGGLAVAAAAVLAGASVVRVHDVRETVDAVKTAAALRDAGYGRRRD